MKSIERIGSGGYGLEFWAQMTESYPQQVLLSVLLPRVLPIVVFCLPELPD
jgi:hypothetical protein